ncbi:MAG: hypothetical protein DRJ52_02685 [Thermoprotei archaeon]|nr:MAG: hypothetical protein DRJ52_02685 [Thermoprotei archaeon]RLE99881.1 MAG: hypothetical protein DRJ63_04090 [Thermoprotei archaeon]HDI74689.1 hypothetical protein [Thermoprotei archaeon]
MLVSKLLYFIAKVRYRRRCIGILRGKTYYIAVFENYYLSEIVENRRILGYLRKSLDRDCILKFSVAIIKSRSLPKVKKGRGLIVGEVDALVILPNGRAVLIEIKAKMPRPGPKMKAYDRAAKYLKKIFGFEDYTIVMLLKKHTVDRAYALKKYVVLPESFLVKVTKEGRSLAKELALL